MKITKRRLRRVISELLTRRMIKEAQTSPADLQPRTAGQPGTQGERMDVSRMVRKSMEHMRTLQEKNYFDSMVSPQRQTELDTRVDSAIQTMDEVLDMLDEEIEAQSAGWVSKQEELPPQ